MIYLDNAATTFPKPRCVIRAVTECIKQYCANPGRSTHQLALRSAERVYETRERIASHLGFEHPDRIIFTQNATHALNLAIQGITTAKSHIITSDFEHNSVLRPLYNSCIRNGSELSFYDSDLPLEDAIAPLIRSDTSLLITSIASNVTGRMINLDELYNIAKKYSLYTVIDASQYLGHHQIDLSSTPFDVVCAPGHKGLLGIQGSGFAVFRNEDDIPPLIYGGSGNSSKLESMPREYPEHLEAGTLNVPAISSLYASISYLEQMGMSEVENRISNLTWRLYEMLESLNIIIHGCNNGIAAFEHPNIPSSYIAEMLDDYNIAVRSGLHCSPIIHQKLGCDELGTVRISLSIMNKESDLDVLYSALKNICK